MKDIIRDYSTPLNIALGATAFGLLLWLVMIWIRNPFTLPEPDGTSKKSLKIYQDIQSPALASFNIILEKDLFRDVREQKKAAVAKSLPVTLPPPVQPPPPRPVPKLALIGTVLIGEIKSAIISSEGRKPQTFKLGDNIDGFILREIKGEGVVLAREGEILEVSIKSGNSSSSIKQRHERMSLNTPQPTTVNQTGLNSKAGQSGISTTLR